MMRRSACRLGHYTHRVYLEDAPEVKFIPSKRPSEAHLQQERFDGVFAKYRKQMADRRAHGNPQYSLRPRTFMFQADDLNFRAADKIKQTRPLIPRNQEPTVHDEKAFPYPFFYFMVFGLTYYWVFFHASTGSVAHYKIPDPDRAHNYIRCQKLPAFKHGKEPLCNPDNHGGLAELRPLLDVSSITVIPQATRPAH